MNKYIKKIQGIICRLFLKVKIIFQSSFKNKTIKNYEEAIKL